MWAYTLKISPRYGVYKRRNKGIDGFLDEGRQSNRGEDLAWWKLGMIKVFRSG